MTSWAPSTYSDEYRGSAMRDALAPARRRVGDDADEQHVPLGLGAERRAERTDEGQSDAAQLHGFELHCCHAIGRVYGRASPWTSS